MSQVKIHSHPKLTDSVVDQILEVAKRDESAARKLLRKITGLSRSRGNEWFNRIKTSLKNLRKDDGESLPELPPELKITSREGRVAFTGDEGVAECVNPDVKTLDDLLKVCKVDLTVWEVEKFVVNKWATARSKKTSNLSFDEGKITGNIEDDGAMKVQPLYQVKAWLKRKISKDTEAIIKELKEDLKNKANVVSKIQRAKSGSYMLELALFDLHLGKMAWREEAGENYDMKIAKTVYRDAVKDLVDKALRYGEIEEILLPIGNDYLHVDSQENTTTAGTRQDTDGRAKKIFREGRKLLVETIDYLKQIAPVKVIVVVGNHDTLSMFHLGDAIECWYHDDKLVTVDNSASLRKYHRYYNTLIGFTHGDKEKNEKLPLIAATERASDWGSTTYKEIHKGHRHMEEVSEFNGVKVRTIPSLSRNDSWHTGMGYGATKSAVGLMFHKTDGLVGVCYHNSPEVKE